ncbi:hypothetical protein JJQ73_02045 [Corynebacterium glutamicum]|uniref:hypothetical protein n=1 Tax=Corynebacterium glutamicum TaxID=1718 RepID=UPI001C6DFBC9|nr:hypothetical protein [Corynebacterium glutamicum]QYR17883.1 hypothetical protein JJQ73_02045 [Corynebacterium glutamicum]
MEVSQNEASQPSEDSSSAKAKFSFFKLVQKRFFWPVLLAIVLVVALVISLVVSLSSSMDEEEIVAVETETSFPSTPTTAETETVRLDSDGDGLFDDQEIEGWRTKDGSVYKTDPFSADTDGDGLTDLEEAGQLLTEPGLEGLTYQGVSNPLKVDSDDDGLDDKAELKGWLDAEGKKYKTNPLEADTDGDGLNDGLEAGETIMRSNGDVVYGILSDPTMADSDNDGLSDAEELNHDTDPFLKDTDGDGLSDGDEILTFGTDPTMADTDGDGLDDRYELEHLDSAGLDPLIHDVRMSKMENATDFAIGAILGDFKQRDSIAWLVGSLTVVGIGMIPPIGIPIGVLADLRDMAASSINRDWVGVGFAAVGLIPIAGDASALTKRISKFVNRTHDMQLAVSKMINRIPLLPESIKRDLRKATWGTSWKELNAKGETDYQLDRLAADGNNLKVLNETLDSNVIIAKPMQPVRTGYQGEIFLEGEYKREGNEVNTQAVMDTTMCTNGSNSSKRRHDLQVDLEPDKIMAVESKVGFQSLTESIKRQINSDICLRDKGLIEAVRWEFMPSKITGQVGMTGPMREYLQENGVEVVIRIAK